MARWWFRSVAIALAVSVAGLLLPAGETRATAIKPYAESTSPEYTVTALLSAGDRVRESSDPTKEYQMVGIPDGLGAHANANGTVTVFMNHEFTSSVKSQPLVGGVMNRGAFVSKWTVAADGTVTAGERAYDTVFIEDTAVGPAPQDDNQTPAFARLCSGYLAGPHNGFDRYVYLAGEESEGAATFSGKGGEAVAIFDNKAHVLPKLGKFAKENLVVMPYSGEQTVIIGLEDGPSGPDSQLYMYVGTKDRKAGATALQKNGLVGGKLYVFASINKARNNEAAFTSGFIVGQWVEIASPETLSDEQLEAAADAAGAFGFVRIEDGAFSKTNGNDFFFVTTGGNKTSGNELGRLYHLRFNAQGVLDSPVLNVVYNADTIVAAGGDIALSPDNIAVSSEYLMVQEDGTAQTRPLMAAKKRDGSIWRFRLNNESGPTPVNLASGSIVAELNPPGRDSTAITPGIWETSGIIDTSTEFGAGSWLFVVQAHSPTAAPGTGTVEDGQLLLLKPVAPVVDLAYDPKAPAAFRNTPGLLRALQWAIDRAFESILAANRPTPAGLLGY
jgi:hypothetical protein